MDTANHVPSINYTLLGRAASYYEKLGYSQVHLPWTVDDEAYYLTAPVNSKSMTLYATQNDDRVKTKKGRLVASAEQSFVDCLLKGQQFDKCFAITPCFRDEPKYDWYHYPYFMKLELYAPFHGDEREVLDMMEDAFNLMNIYIPCKKVPVDQGYMAYDIETKAGVELGSYGVRELREHRWIYGTGLAEPRFSNELRLYGYGPTTGL